LAMILKEAKDNGGGDDGPKEQANPGDEDQQRVDVRRKVGSLLGVNGNGDCTVYSAPRSSGGKRPVEIPGRQLLAPARNQNSSDQAKNRQHAAQPDQLENRRAIGGRRGVVLIAKKEHVVDG